MEPKHERCVECGGVFSQMDLDPDPRELQSLVGIGLGVISDVSLKRPRLPGHGALWAHEGGLLFLPDLRELPTGGLVAVEPAAPPTAGGIRPGFWHLFSRRGPTVVDSPVTLVRPQLSADDAVERLLNSPGALFIPRNAIMRMQHRGTVLRVERKPGRTIVCRLESPPSSVHLELRRLFTQPGWASVVVS
jgi:hypothetical protein